jgi:DNA-binding SARP family transcriptional activator
MPGLPGQKTTFLNTEHQCEFMPLYKVHFFGPFRVTRGNQPVGESVWRRNKAKVLLKWFLLNPGSMFSTDQLLTNFWPDMPRASAERNFHVAIHYLRHLLEPDLAPRQKSKYIRRNKDNFYWFELDDDWWVDTSAIQHHYKEGKEAEQRNEQAVAITHYRQIIEYCRLGFLHEDAYEDTFSTHRHHYECIYTRALTRLIHLYTEAGMVDEVLTYAQQALLIDPYCEFAVRAIAYGYFLQGNTAGAIHRLDHFQALLKEDLMEPGEELLSLRKEMVQLE